MNAISAVRSRRSEMNVPPSKKPHLIIVTEQRDIFESGRSYLSKLAYAGEVTVTDTAPEDVSGMVSVVTDEARLFMPLAELVDLEAERARVRKSLEKARRDLAGQEAKLANESFVSRAPEKVVNTEREKKAKLEALIENLEASLAALN